MFRLGLRLAVQGGRETLVRLLVTALAVTIGTALLFSVLAIFHGYQTAQSKPCFMLTNPDCTPVTADQDDSEAVLGLYRRDVYKGETITRLDLAQLSNHSLSIPGVPHMPQAGEYYVSPAMAVLLEKAPTDELGDRYPGKQVGTIGEAGLHSPDELIVIIGREAADISSLPGVVLRIKSIGAEQASNTNTAFLQFAAVLGAAALLFPMLVLVGSATRLGAARREERYAAFRLVGATPRQVSVIASADAALGSALGAIAGIGLFFGLQPFLADLAITGNRFFASDVRPAAWEFVLIAAGVPVSAIVASFLSLRRVRISPLGVTRKTTPPKLRVLGLLPLVLGIVLFTGAVMIASSDDPPFVIVPGLILIMVGLITGGPWLTLKTTRIVAWLAHGASALLAVRRLADNPKAAFRAVSGLVLVVFAASVVAFLAPAILTQRLSTESGALDNVFTAEFPPSGDRRSKAQDDSPPAPGLKPAEGKQLIQQLQSIPGVEAFPIYNSASTAQAGPTQDIRPLGPPPAIIGCDSLERLEALGVCPAGAQAAAIDRDTFSDVMVHHRINSVATKESQPQSINADTMLLRGLLVRAGDATALEKARTLLAQKTVAPFSEMLLTFGETRKAAQATEDKLQAIVSGAVIITLVTAGSSIAVAVAGAMIERRRPFTLLRLGGAPLSTLYRVVLWEAAVPLISATLVAVAIGFGVAALVISGIAPDGANARIEMPDLPYILALAAGPVIALLVVSTTLPLVGRLTKPDNVRFE